MYMEKVWENKIYKFLETFWLNVDILFKLKIKWSKLENIDRDISD